MHFESLHSQFVQNDTPVRYVCSSVCCEVIMCLLTSSCNVKKKTVLCLSHECECLTPQHIVTDIVTLRYLSDSCLFFSA